MVFQKKKLMTNSNKKNLKLKELTPFSSEIDFIQLSKFLKIFFNLFMKEGKKRKISNIIFKVIALIKQNTKSPVLPFFNHIFIKIKPIIMLTPQHQGRLKRLIPILITPNRQIFLAAS